MTVLLQIAAIGQQRVLLLPRFDLFLGAIGRGVGGRVAGEAVGDGVQQHRPAARLQHLTFAFHGIGNGQRVVAVDAFGMHRFRVDRQTDTRHAVLAKPHGLTKRLPAHAVEVVHEIEQDRRRAADILRPERTVLVHRREHHRFPHRPAAHGGVADVGDDDAGPAVDALEQRRAGRDIGRAADDRVVRHDSEGREESVHRAAHALVEAGSAGEDLGQRAVKGEIEGHLSDAAAREGLDDSQHRAVQVGLHDLGQRGVVQLGDGGEALGQDLAVAAVRAKDEVVGRQVVRLADRGRFLADGEVRRAAVVVLDALVDAFLFDAVQHGLELADGEHVAIHPYQVLAAVAARLGGRVRLIAIDRNLRRSQHALGPHLRGVDGD